MNVWPASRFLQKVGPVFFCKHFSWWLKKRVPKPELERKRQRQSPNALKQLWASPESISQILLDFPRAPISELPSRRNFRMFADLQNTTWLMCAFLAELFHMYIWHMLFWKCTPLCSLQPLLTLAPDNPFIVPHPRLFLANQWICSFVPSPLTG